MDILQSSGSGIISLAYIGASILFIFGLKMLGSPATARRGNLLSALGMLLAVVITLLNKDIVSWQFITLAAILGAIIGSATAILVKMTSMPEMVAVFNGFGGLASLLVGSGEYLSGDLHNSATLFAIYLTLLIGGVTFTGSLVAYGKLSEIISGSPLLYRGQQIVNGILLLILLGVGIELIWLQDTYSYEISHLILALTLLAFILGILLVIPIGGADMPVVIALLNSYSGLAACAAGFVIQNNVLIVAGALVGASGLILTNIMCKAMNRSLANVLFSGFGSGDSSSSSSAEDQGEVNPISSQDAYLILEAATSVLIVPGYGMAVAQAQHTVRELGELLEDNGAEVKYGIHPVAGRMPGHMNVLLAEANVSYDALVEPDDVNPVMETVDICLVIGANDVVNPDAKDNEGSPIYGMPIIEVDRAKTVFVLKRSMASGFAGIQNPLFFKSNTRMLFGDAKESISEVVSEFKS
ncbi:MAG: NAD(P)(+) transhydrogenase (Re/Si-specific) subunit beta [SAR86 cluster bacterium]|jgi:H+-translocating NAD(P) transhydrogenase subunit beta|nr:NAD(P)(+) transhydrogenase (Re/Si-specific) subunit beta [SAR86 cluster bacterium]